MEKINRIEKSFKTMNIKGKQYVEVKERIKYLAYDFTGNYSITTEFWHYPESKTWVVKATLTMEQGGMSSVYTGLAQEVESDSYKDVNHTSALENCETSAIGRACAMAGIGVDISIASADEMNKALNRINKAPQDTQPAKPMQGKPKPVNVRQRPIIDTAIEGLDTCTSREDMVSIWNTHTALHSNKLFLEALERAGKKYPKKEEAVHAS
jgi:transposase